MSELLSINVNEHTEEKNGLTYLSWAWAWAEVLKIDSKATWEAAEFDGFPAIFGPDQTALVKTVVTIKDRARSCWLPVMDHRNKAVQNPNAFQINTAIVRCLVKTIAMHGLGLYIYAGEDLPESQETDEDPLTKLLDDFAASMVKVHEEGNTLEAVRMWYKERPASSNEAMEYLWSQLHDYSDLRSAIKANKPT